VLQPAPRAAVMNTSELSAWARNMLPPMGGAAQLANLCLFRERASGGCSVNHQPVGVDTRCRRIQARRLTREPKEAHSAVVWIGLCQCVSSRCGASTATKQATVAAWAREAAGAEA
jgi:hypothetical protein